MSRRVTVLLMSLGLALLGAAGVAYLLWPSQSADEEKARAFCWKVNEKVSSGAVKGSVSECAGRLETAAKKDRAALRTEVRLYGRHVAEDRGRIPEPVRRALSRALAERPGLVHEGLAAGGERGSGGTRPYLDRAALSSTVLALAEDDVAWETLRASQESYGRSRIGTLTRADFSAGMEGARVVSVVEPVGRASATLTSLARHARPDASEGNGDDEDHGYPLVRNQLEDRARSVGVPQQDIQNSGSSMGDLKVALRRAYDAAADQTESAARRAGPP